MNILNVLVSWYVIKKCIFWSSCSSK